MACSPPRARCAAVPLARSQPEPQVVADAVFEGKEAGEKDRVRGEVNGTWLYAFSKRTESRARAEIEGVSSPLYP